MYDYVNLPSQNLDHDLFDEMFELRHEIPIGGDLTYISRATCLFSHDCRYVSEYGFVV